MNDEDVSSEFDEFELILFFVVFINFLSLTFNFPFPRYIFLLLLLLLLFFFQLYDIKDNMK